MPTSRWVQMPSKPLLSELLDHRGATLGFATKRACRSPLKFAQRRHLRHQGATREAGKAHLDSLGGTREAGKD